MNVVIEALQDKRKALEQQLEEVREAIKRFQLTQPAEVSKLVPQRKRKAKRTMSAEAREKLRQAALARWAAKKAGAGNGKQAQKRPTQAKPTGQKAKSQPLATVTGESAA